MSSPKRSGPFKKGSKGNSSKNRWYRQYHLISNFQKILNPQTPKIVIPLILQRAQVSSQWVRVNWTLHYKNNKTTNSHLQKSPQKTLKSINTSKISETWKNSLRKSRKDCQLGNLLHSLWTYKTSYIHVCLTSRRKKRIRKARWRVFCHLKVLVFRVLMKT